MTVLAFNSDVSKDQLLKYADTICFWQVGLQPPAISEKLDLPEHLVSAWIDNWHHMECQVFRA